MPFDGVSYKAPRAFCAGVYPGFNIRASTFKIDSRSWHILGGVRKTRNVMYRLSTSSAVVLVFVASLVGCNERSLDFDETSTNDDETSTAEAEESIVDCSVAWEKELMITDPSVVRDNRAKNMGPWSFGGIMQALRGNTNAQEFTKRFVESWLTDQVVDGITVPARPKMKSMVLDPWKARSGNGTYDLSKSPFELLAIVYRVDLRKQGNLGSGGGEGRFVYGVRNAQGAMAPFTVIAEFKLPRRNGRSAEVWANDWHALGKLTLGSAAYNQKLEQITNQFACGSAKANKNLNQLRTNEIALDLGLGHPPIWQLREFHIESDGYLHPARPAQTPSNTVNGTAALTTYVQQNAAAIAKKTQKVPAMFLGTPFGAAAADVPTNSFTWNVPGVSATLKQQFSLQTCNGCHAGDTGTNFLHVGPGQANGGAAQLSNFVVNTEMPRRTLELKQVLGCVPGAATSPDDDDDDDEYEDDLR